LTIMVVGICAAPSLAHAATPYVSANVGLGLTGNSSDSDSNVISYKTSVPFGGAVGLKSDEYRLEAALGYVSNSIDKLNGTSLSGDKISFFSYMANAYYDYALNKSSFTPYVMGGIGGASITPKGPDISDTATKSVFAWQLGAGIGVKATENVVFDLGYRYFKPSAYTSNDGSKTTLSSSNIMLGVRYNF